jgi:hypothetical protein
MPAARGRSFKSQAARPSQAVLQVLGELLRMFEVVSIGSAPVYPSEQPTETVGVETRTSELVNNGVALGLQDSVERCVMLGHRLEI